jgi:hypothetical protein
MRLFSEPSARAVLLHPDVGVPQVAKEPTDIGFHEQEDTMKSNATTTPLVSLVKIIPNDKGIPHAKLADVELHFGADRLAGLKLVGFAIWEGREGRHVTFPARPFVVNGERRSYAVLRPIADPAAQDALCTMILDAFAKWQAADSH